MENTFVDEFELSLLAPQILSELRLKFPESFIRIRVTIQFF